MRSKLRQGRAIAAIVAAAILTAVLVLTVVADNGVLPGNDEMPASGVVATVNGVEITQADVVELRALHETTYDRSIPPEAALEQLIMMEVVYQAAESGDYLPTAEETRERLEAQLDMMGMTMDDFEEMLEERGLCYDEQVEDFRRELAMQDYLQHAVAVPEITEEKVREFYEDWKQTLPAEQDPPSFEDMEEQIIMHLQQEKQQEATFDLIDGLIEAAGIEEYP